MPLAAGARLGVYEVTAQIGEGGMGQVWRAHDTKLNRDVALKVLPDAFATDPDRLARFTREAQTLAALNHPNIAAIYGIESHALVMELVEGEDLSQRIARGAIPIDEALPIAKQIAEALEAAHEQGIIHRDLKPANIKVRSDGTVKVLDFGLAKAMDPTGASSVDAMNSPTLTAQATQAGVILGTAAYMSPEQARGKTVDKRADIWAFGVVLYEMLTGRPAFAGETVSDTLAAVLTRDLDLHLAPATMRRLLRSCLQKDPKHRLQAIGDSRLLLDADGAAPLPGRPPRRWPAALATTLALIAVVALGGWWRSTRPVERTPQPLMQLNVDLGPDVSMGITSGSGSPEAVLSPDGTSLVYVSHSKLFLRRLDQPQATELPGTEGASVVFFKPDGQWVGFVANTKLKRVSLTGGAPIDIGDVGTNIRGGSWGDDGNIVIPPGTFGGLMRIPSAGGAFSPLTTLASGEITHRFPQVLPGGKAALFTAHSSAIGFDEAHIDVVSFADGRRTTLVRGGTFGQYLESGHLIYVRRNTLFAQSFDLSRLQVTGTAWPVWVGAGSGFSTQFGGAQFSVSRTGTLVYRPGEAKLTVQWLDASGRTKPVLAAPGSYQRPRLSPNGQKLALTVVKGSGSDIVVYDLQTGLPTQLTFDDAFYDGPVWTPDGRYVVFLGPEGLWWTRSDGAGKPRRLTSANPHTQFPFSFTVDGKRLAFHQATAGSGFDLWTVAVTTDASGLSAKTPELFLHNQFDLRHPAFSPDGRWIAYASDERGGFEIFVKPFPDTGARRKISESGGVYPIWSSQNELFFRTLDNRIMVAHYTVTGDTFVREKPRVWSDKHLADIGTILNYDIQSDGKRVVALMPAEGPEELERGNHVTFLLNFFDEVRRRAKQ